jgi:hypothetical protein
MSDSPNNGIRIPKVWLKAIIVPLVTALLAGGGVARLIHGDSAAIQTGNLNRSLQTEYDLRYALRDIADLQKRIRELERRE